MACEASCRRQQGLEAEERAAHTTLGHKGWVPGGPVVLGWALGVLLCVHPTESPQVPPYASLGPLRPSARLAVCTHWGPPPQQGRKPNPGPGVGVVKQSRGLRWVIHRPVCTEGDTLTDGYSQAPRAIDTRANIHTCVLTCT